VQVHEICGALMSSGGFLNYHNQVNVGKTWYTFLLTRSVHRLHYATRNLLQLRPGYQDLLATNQLLHLLLRVSVVALLLLLQLNIAGRAGQGSTTIVTTTTNE
jgi:hypothetical protein